MSGARIFLGISVLIWLPYGIYCFLVPGSLADSAGVVATSGTGSTELRAMYGGLQAAIGVLALAGFMRDRFVTPALMTIGLLTSGLFLTRLLGTVIDGDFSSYTGGVLVFEALIACSALWLLRGRSDFQPSNSQPS